MINLESEVLERFQKWYASMCNDDWEHTNGVVISNIDNPGWFLKIDLKDTYLYGIEFTKSMIQRDDENDWILCKVEDGCFQGYGGPLNLSELIKVFLDWADSEWAKSEK